jgi:hypothetical protein
MMVFSSKPFPTEAPEPEKNRQPFGFRQEPLKDKSFFFVPRPPARPPPREFPNAAGVKTNEGNARALLHFFS